MPELLIMACPYCGSPDVHETSRLVNGPEYETVTIVCLTCDEECMIDRNLDSRDERHGD